LNALEGAGASDSGTPGAAGTLCVGKTDARESASVGSVVPRSAIGGAPARCPDRFFERKTVLV